MAKTPSQTPRAVVERRFRIAIVLLLTVILVCSGLYLFLHFRCRLFGHEPIPADCENPSRCARCDEVLYAPMGHRWQPADCVTEGFCVYCHQVYQEPLGHDFGENSCLDASLCSRCGAEGAPATGHDWLPATCETAATCTRCGLEDGDPLGHDWLPATKTDPETCTLCQATQGEPLQPTLFLYGLEAERVASPQWSNEDDVVTLSWDSSRPYIDFDESYLEVMGTYICGYEIESYFLISWDGRSITIQPRKSLPCGAYHFCFEASEGYIGVGLSYGYEGEYYEGSYAYDRFYWYDLTFQNQHHGWYITRTETGLGTTRDSWKKVYFADNDHVCQIIEDNVYYGHSSNEAPMTPMRLSPYVLHGEALLYLIVSKTLNTWYMGADSYGNIYFTHTPTEACYWRILY